MNPGESCLPGNFFFEVGYLEIIDKFKELSKNAYFDKQ